MPVPPPNWHQHIASVPAAGSYASGGIDWRALHIDMPSGIHGMRRGRTLSADARSPTSAGGGSPLSPMSPGRAAGHPVGGPLDPRALHLDQSPRLGGLHRSGWRDESRSPPPQTMTKTSSMMSLKAVGVPLQSMSMDTLPGRRHVPAPSPKPEHRSEIVHMAHAFHSARVVGRARSRTNAKEEVKEHIPLSARELRRLHRALSPHEELPAEQGEMKDAEASNAAAPGKLAGSLNRTRSGVDYGVSLKKLDLPVKGRKSGLGAGSNAFSMTRSLRRLDSCAMKLEMVAQALVQEAQRQSLKRVA